MVETHLVAGAGYTFSAPHGWEVSRQPHGVSVARPGSDSDLVSVSRYRLPRVPTAREIDAAADSLARRLRGRVVAGKWVHVAARRSRQFEIAYAVRGEELGVRLTFVIEGRREFQLLCRWQAPPVEETTAACKGLHSSFKLV
jgi:hypothetical protein